MRTGYTGAYTIVISEEQRELIELALARLPTVSLGTSERIRERAMLLKHFGEIKGSPREMTHGFCL